ncbi:YceI family protein [Nocardia sp. NPDC059240]|uniref:YceI family protein n=1 Tax=Nocardia sp. NPDC059240 TaxID=3346786 RepID=UPI00367D7671
MTTSTRITLAPGRWTLDLAPSTVAFTLRSFGLIKVRGEFQRFDTEFVVDDAGAAAIEATIHLDSFHTGNAKRDDHVRHADFLDVENRPTMTFRAPAPVVIGESFEVDGEVAFADRIRPLTLSAAWNGLRPHPVTGRQAIAFTATGALDRTEFGVGPSFGGMIGKTLTLDLGIHLIEPA